MQHDLRRAALRVGEHVGALRHARRPLAYFLRSMKPSFWRVSTRHTGPCVCSIATRHASAVSVASAGRMTVSSGIARSADSCSTGWCVGPSSPSPIESCV